MRILENDIYAHDHILVERGENLMISRKEIRMNSSRLIVYFILIVVLLEVVPLQAGNAQMAPAGAGLSTVYPVTFTETGLLPTTQWTVKVIVNNSANYSYNSTGNVIIFNETNGTYNYVAMSTTSYVTSNASGVLNVSGAPESVMINFERTAVSEYYQPFMIMNTSQERNFELNPQSGPGALSFGVMNTTVVVQAYNSSGLIYERNITGEPTNFNTTSVTGGYGYVNFQSSGSVSVYATDIGSHSGYFALDLWNYYISNYSASLITLPPHLQEIFGTGTLNPRIPSFVVENNTGMSFTLKAPYYRESVPMAIFVGEGFYNTVNGDYWWAQLGFNNWLTSMYDVSYAGWGIFSNYANTTGGTDDNYPLVPNETYNFTMEVVSNHSWEFLVNGLPVQEDGHSAFYNAPTDYASDNAYLGVEVLVGQRSGPLNSTNFFQGSIVIPDAESFKVDGKWMRASNVSFLSGVRDWEDGHGGGCAGMNLWGVQGNIQNTSIPKGEIILNNGPAYPYDVPMGTNYDIYPISGNFSFPMVNTSVPQDFIHVASQSNGTILIAPLQKNTEVSIVRFRGDTNIADSEYGMIISQPTYVENPSYDSRAGIFSVPINSTTSQPGYGGAFQEIVMSPILSYNSNRSNTFSLGDLNTSYMGEVYVPVYINNASSLENLEQLYSFDSSLLQFNGTLADLSSQNVSFSYASLAKGVEEIDAAGLFDILSDHTLLFYLVFAPLVKEQFSTTVLLDASQINGFRVQGNSSSRVIVTAGWRSIGPSEVKLSGSSMSYGGMISTVGYSPYNLDVIYAAAGQSYPFSGPYGYPGDTGFGGVLKSTDGGKSWNMADLGITSASVTSIVVEPENPNVAVIETRGLQGANPVGGAIFKTVNGGLSWEQTYSLGGYQLEYENGALFATTFHSILKSDNFGTTWIQIASFSSVVTSSLILNNGEKIYVGIWTQDSNVTDELLESTNYGQSFELLLNLTQSEFHGKEPSIGQIISSPSDEQDMWAIVNSPYPAEWVGNPSLFRSLDGGETWQLVNTSALGLGSQQEPPSFITYDPENGNIIYLNGLGGLYRSTDGGNYFNRIGEPENSSFLGMISVDPLNDSIIFLCSESGLFESVNEGGAWSSISNFSSNLLFDMAVDNQNIFATDEGLSPLYSNDSGKNWTTINKGYLGIVAVDSYNSSIVIMWTETHTTAGGPFFFVSNDGGKSFFLPSLNFTAEINPSVDNIAFSNGGIFVPGGTGIFYSTDSGSTWSVLKDSPRNASTVVDSPTDQGILYASNSSGLYRSSNYGQSWNLVNSVYLNSIAVDPLNSSIIVGSTWYGSSYTFRLMISYNGGGTFANLGIRAEEYELSSPYVYFYESSGNAILVFTSDQGIYISTDLGSSWLNCSYNLPSTVINSFYATPNGTAYVAAYGSGIFVDPSLFNFTFNINPPVITGYVPAGGNLSVDGIEINTAGYFSMEIRSGNNTIEWEGEKLSLSAAGGGVYFLNFSNMQIFLTVKEENLPAGTGWNVIANGRNYSIMGNGLLTLPPSTSGIYVLPVATDYSIYYPLNNFYPLNSSLVSSITVQFDQSVKAVYRNVSSSMNGMFWSTQIAYNRGYILYAGGTLGLLNVTSDEGQRIQSPDYSGTADSAVPFGTGFLVGGSASQDRPGIYYYDVSTGEFTNLSVLLPASWNTSRSAISSLFVVNSSAFGFIGGGVDSAYFGMVDGGEFINLTPYLPSSFTPSNGWFNRYSGAYLSSCRGFVLSDGTDIGIFYLQNRSFHDISQLMPSGFYVGMPGNEWSPSSDFITSNGTTAIITGIDNMRQFTVLYSPDKGIRDISDLFPSSEYMNTVTWQGGDIVLSGHESNSNSSSIFIYNTTRQIPTAINTTYYGNTSMIDSAIMVGNSVYFTTFNVKTVPNESYVVFLSYYGAVGLTPTGCINVRVNIPSSIEINNETYFATTASIPEFTGNYTLTVSSPGYVSYDTSVNVSPFENLYLNVTLETKTYGITFTEDGLPSGISWSVTLNGTTESTVSDSITFKEPNGTYTYTTETTDIEYAPTHYSGSFTVKGGPVSQSITFSEVTYSVTFTESGLPPGTTWYVTLNGTMKSSLNNTIIFSEVNGSYSYNIQSISGYRTTNYSGSITVNGNSINENIVWSVILYPITITENGISNGTTWSATLTGTTFTGQQVNVTLSSATDSITFSEPNGSYSYTVHLPSGYTGTNLSGSFKSTGQPVTANITARPATDYTLIIIVALIAIVAVTATIVVMMRRGQK